MAGPWRAGLDFLPAMDDFCFSDMNPLFMTPAYTPVKRPEVNKSKEAQAVKKVDVVGDKWRPLGILADGGALERKPVIKTYQRKKKVGNNNVMGGVGKLTVEGVKVENIVVEPIVYELKQEVKMQALEEVKTEPEMIEAKGEEPIDTKMEVLNVKEVIQVPVIKVDPETIKIKEEPIELYGMEIPTIYKIKEEPIIEVAIDTSVVVTDENPEECDICGKLFSSHKLYKDHLKLCIEQYKPRIRSNEEVEAEVRGQLLENKVPQNEAETSNIDYQPMEEEESVDGESDEETELERLEIMEKYEQRDARELYPRRKIGNGKDHFDDQEDNVDLDKIEESVEKFSEEIKHSIKIMESSCFHTDIERENAAMANKELGISQSTSCQHPKYECSSCDRSFASTKCYARHLYAHTFVRIPIEDEPYICSNCGKEFRKKYLLDLHFSQTGCIGLPKVLYPCKLCGKTFTRKDNLREHLKGHAGAVKTRKKHECKYCGKVFGGSTLLTIHIRMHTGDRPYKCDFCDKSFSSTTARKKHRRTHTGEKPYSCNYCEGKFSAKETLNRHVKTHTGVKPHQCPYCEKRFIQHSSLKAHTFLHTGEGGFSCEKCDKTFNRKARLVSHMQYVHEGMKPNKCEHCHKEFVRKEDLNRHILVAHSTYTGSSQHILNVTGTEEVDKTLITASEHLDSKCAESVFIKDEDEFEVKFEPITEK